MIEVVFFLGIMTIVTIGLMFCIGVIAYGKESKCDD